MSVTLRDILRGVGAGLQTYGTMRYNRQMNELDAQQREQTLAQQMAHQRAMQEDSQAQQLAYLARQDELIRGREREQRAFDYPEVPGAIDLSGLGGGKIPSMGRQIDGLPGYRINRNLMDQMMMPKQEPQMYGDGWYTPSGPDQARLIRMRGDINGGSGGGSGSDDIAGNPAWIPWDVNQDGTIMPGEVANIWALTQSGINPYAKPGENKPDPLSVLDRIRAIDALLGSGGVDKPLMTPGQDNALKDAGRRDEVIGEYVDEVAKGADPATAWARISTKYLQPGASILGGLLGHRGPTYIQQTPPTLNAQMMAPTAADTSSSAVARYRARMGLNPVGQ